MALKAPVVTCDRGSDVSTRDQSWKLECSLCDFSCFENSHLAPDRAHHREQTSGCPYREPLEGSSMVREPCWGFQGCPGKAGSTWWGRAHLQYQVVSPWSHCLWDRYGEGAGTGHWRVFDKHGSRSNSPCFRYSEVTFGTSRFLGEVP